MLKQQFMLFLDDYCENYNIFLTFFCLRKLHFFSFRRHYYWSFWFGTRVYTAKIYGFFIFANDKLCNVYGWIVLFFFDCIIFSLHHINRCYVWIVTKCRKKCAKILLDVPYCAHNMCKLTFWYVLLTKWNILKCESTLDVAVFSYICKN